MLVNCLLIHWWWYMHGFVDKAGQDRIEACLNILQSFTATAITARAIHLVIWDKLIGYR